MAGQRPIRAESDPRVEPYKMYTSAHEAFGGQEVRVLTRVRR
jgi:hypothetical protein